MFSFDLSQMFGFKSVAAVAIATASIALAAPQAQARPGFGCYKALAAQDIVNVVRGGGSIEEALRYAYNRGNMDGSRGCFYSVKGYIRRYGHVL